jgi:putative transposase
VLADSELPAGGPYRCPLRQQNLCLSKQIAFVLRQAEAGTPVGEICRKRQISETTFYRWKKRYGSLGTPEIRELRQLRDENRKLKQLAVQVPSNTAGRLEATAVRAGLGPDELRVPPPARVVASRRMADQREAGLPVVC